MKKVSFSYLCLLGVCSLAVGFMGNSFAMSENAGDNNTVASEQMPAAAQTAEPQTDDNAVPTQSDQEESVSNDQQETASEQAETTEQPAAMPNGDMDETEPAVESPSASTNGQEEAKPDQMTEETQQPAANGQEQAAYPADSEEEQQSAGNGDTQAGKSVVLPIATTPSKN